MKLFTPLRAALVVALPAVAAGGFLLIPAGTRLPVHWGITGEADGFAAREVALLMPLGLAGFVWGYAHRRRPAGGHQGRQCRPPPARRVAHRLYRPRP